MHFVSKLTPEQWAEARCLREAGASFGAIAKTFDITAGNIRRRARKQGWRGPDPQPQPRPQPQHKSEPRPRNPPLAASHGAPPQAAVQSASPARPMSKAAARAARKQSAERRRPLPDDPRQARACMSRRIFTILDLDLKIMELRMHKRLNEAESGGASEGMSEEEIKRLGTFKKTIQDHTETSPDTEPTAGAAARPRSTQAIASEADVFRREIAERLEKLIPPS